MIIFMQQVALGNLKKYEHVNWSLTLHLYATEPKTRYC